MQKKLFKLSIAIVLAIICLFCFNQVVLADNFDDGLSIDTATVASNVANGKLENAVANTMVIGVNIIKVIGTGVSVIMLTYMAIKYMSAAPAEKADFKKSATIYVLGAVLVFASTNILAIIIDFATKTLE